MIRFVGLFFFIFLFACGDENANNGIEGDPIDRDVCKEDIDCLEQPRFNDSRLAECIPWTYEPNQETGVLENTGEQQWLYCSECKQDSDCPEGLLCERFTWCTAF